jgi:hypothetical protein
MIILQITAQFVRNNQKYTLARVPGKMPLYKYMDEGE